MKVKSKIYVILFLVFSVSNNASGHNNLDNILSDAIDAYYSSDAPLKLVMKNLRMGKNLYSLKLVRATEMGSVSESGRKRENLSLEGMAENNKIGKIDISISFPKNFDLNRQYPVLFVAAGINIGQEAIDLVDLAGENILVGFDYPKNKISGLEKWDILALSLEKIPGQMAVVLGWLSQQKWCDKSRISTLGVSFGVIFLPLAQRIAQYQNVLVHSSVLA